jgi:hypothetical protein
VRGAFRAILCCAVGIVFDGCAHVEPPPGGPEDNDPPGILTTSPARDTVVPGYDRPVVFTFDERISERGLEDAVLVSPRTSPVQVRHSRDEITVSLRRGWEADRIYQVILAPDILDLFGNRLAEREMLVFSTGPEIPETRAAGTVTDRLTARPETGVRVEAIRTADSLVYAVPTDTAGSFVIQQIPPGEYLLRAFEDMNRSRSLELFEPRDSAFVVIAEDEPPEDVAFRLLAPDSTAPEAGSATLRQRLIEIQFDDYLDPDQELDSTQVMVVGSNGSEPAVARVTVGTSAQIFPPADDSVAAIPRLPARELLVALEDSAVLEPEMEYIITVRGIQNVNGLVAEVEVSVTTPPAPPDIAFVVSRPEPNRYISRRRGRRRLRNLNFVADNGRT